MILIDDSYFIPVYDINPGKPPYEGSPWEKEVSVRINVTSFDIFLNICFYLNLSFCNYYRMNTFYGFIVIGR